MRALLSNLSLALLSSLSACRISPESELKNANLLLHISNISPAGKLLWVVAIDANDNRRDFAPVLSGQETLDLYVTGLSKARFSVQVQSMDDLTVIQCFQAEAVYSGERIPISAALRDGPCETIPGCLRAEEPTEVCNGRDDDCNGFADDGLPEKVFGVGACQCRGPACAGGRPAPNCAPSPPELQERCNGFDDDCDGRLPQNEADNDQDGFLACAPCAPDAQLQCGDCNNDVGSIAPTLPELCDGLDNDCNGLVDDGILCP